MRTLCGTILVAVVAVCADAKAGPSVVQSCPGYNAWPMIQAVGDKLVCAYSRGSAHTVGEGLRGVFARTSKDGGATWSDEVTVCNAPEWGEVTVGKGLDASGAMLLWIRRVDQRGFGEGSFHDLWRTVDGVAWEKVATPKLDPSPVQITDIFSVPGKGLMSLWFAGDYKNNAGGCSWGTLTSGDNGRTWTQRTVERGLSKVEWPTEPSAAYLGDGRILAIARTERGGRCQFQLTSTDFGNTWRRRSTNISDVLESTPSLLFSPATGIVANYYYQRGARKLKCRVAKANDVFRDPESWPPPETLAEGVEERDYDAGNVNATSSGSTHYLAFYTGSTSNTEVRVVLRETADVGRGAENAPLRCVSGVYPHLAMFNDEGECRTGAVVPWAGDLWVITYGPHCPAGSTDKLYRIKPDLTRETFVGSVGGTPANRIIHRETNQLLIGPYVIDAKGNVRVVPPAGSGSSDLSV